MGRGVEDPEFVAHLLDELLCLFSVGRLDLDLEVLAGSDGLDRALETRLVDEVTKYGLALRIAGALLVRDDDIDRENGFFGRSS